MTDETDDYEFEEQITNTYGHGLSIEHPTNDCYIITQDGKFDGGLQYGRWAGLPDRRHGRVRRGVAESRHRGIFYEARRGRISTQGNLL